LLESTTNALGHLAAAIGFRVEADGITLDFVQDERRGRFLDDAFMQLVDDALSLDQAVFMKFDELRVPAYIGRIKNMR
jgi:hypothetical protein